MSELTCSEFEALGAELALGILEGRERADALAHVENCARCRQELTAMGGVADRLVELTPSAEPPAGFETRVLARLTAPPPGPAAATTAPPPEPAGATTAPPPEPAGATTAPKATVRRRSVRWRAARWAVAAGIAAGIGVGGWAIGHQGGSTSSYANRSGPVRTASIVAGRRAVGLVVAYGGSHPWVAVSVDHDLGVGTVECELVERDGAISTVGTFALAAGSSYWGAPIRVAPASVSGLRLLDGAGATIATATFAT